METNTIDQSVGSAESALMSAIQRGQDFSQFKDESSTVESLSSNAEPSTLKTTDSRSESDASEPVLNQATSQPTEEGITKQTEGVATNPTDSTKPVKARAPTRIQELLEQGKFKDSEIAKRDAELAELRKNQAPKQDQGKQEPQALIPKPQFTTEYLQTELAKYEQQEAEAILAQDKEGLLYARNYIKGLNRLLRDNESWDSKNADAIKTHNSQTDYFKGEALKKWESLKDPNSAHTKEYMGIRGWMNQNIPEFLQKPVSEYVVAQIADWKMNSSMSSARLVATEAELKKAKEEIANLKKGSLPLDSKTKTEVSSNNSRDSSLKEAEDNLKKSLRAANLGFGAQTM